jgi:hypothetical protein
MPHMLLQTKEAAAVAKISCFVPYCYCRMQLLPCPKAPKSALFRTFMLLPDAVSAMPLGTEQTDGPLLSLSLSRPASACLCQPHLLVFLLPLLSLPGFLTSRKNRFARQNITFLAEFCFYTVVKYK